MIWMIALLFACISIIFFMGKGSFLIAGYNTASKEEKARYDEKKLCKVMGIGTSIITVALVLSAFGKTEMTTISVVLILLAVVFIIFGTNKYCK